MACWLVQAIVAYDTYPGAVRTREMHDGQILTSIARDALVSLPREAMSARTPLLALLCLPLGIALRPLR